MTDRLRKLCAIWSLNLQAHDDRLDASRLEGAVAKIALGTGPVVIAVVVRSVPDVIEHDVSNLVDTFERSKPWLPFH